MDLNKLCVYDQDTRPAQARQTFAPTWNRLRNSRAPFLCHEVGSDVWDPRAVTPLRVRFPGSKCHRDANAIRPQRLRAAAARVPRATY